MTFTPNLTLPYIAPAQAQKHVTHNEALRALDALVQLAVESRSVSQEPAAPVEGARYVLPSDRAGPAWSAMTPGTVAAFQDGAWRALSPRDGFLAWIIDESAAVVWSASAWRLLTADASGGSQRVNGLTPHEQLRIERTAPTIISLGAEALTLFDDNGGALRVADVELVVDADASGLGGVDAGAPQPGAWLHLWAVSNGADVAAVLSGSATLPVPPAGYVFRGYLGAAFFDASSEFTPFSQMGAEVSIAPRVVVGAGNATVDTAVDLAGAAPPTASSVLIDAYAYRTSGASRVWLIVGPKASTSEQYSVFVNNPPSSNTGTAGAIQLQNRVPLLTPQKLWYKVAAGAHAASYIYVLGFRY